MPAQSTTTTWDYLIVTASNDAQAKAYESQLALRRHGKLLSQVRELMVVADPQGRRVGSGGSTIFCLLQVVNRELAFQTKARPTLAAVESILKRLRVLIIHAGGDSRRLPAYGPCGKIFIPVPGEAGAQGVTLFDRLAPGFLTLPAGIPGAGQVVMAAGDALILLDASNVSLAFPGMTALTCPATPEHASKHGVFCPNASGKVRLYLQKPNPEQQKLHGAIGAGNQSLLDIGIMSFDSSLVLALFKAFGVKLNPDGKLAWSREMEAKILDRGVDFYREICCALGAQATVEHHFQQTRSSGSSWPEKDLQEIFVGLAGTPFHLQTVPECRFLHFGTTKQLITSGAELRQYDASRRLSQGKGVEAKGYGATGQATKQPSGTSGEEVLALNNQILGAGAIAGPSSWVEGCRISARLELAGQNVLVGVNVTKPLSLPAGACLDVLQGANRQGQAAWFIRCYGIGDTFKDSLPKGATFCGHPFLDWLAKVGASVQDVWEKGLAPEQCSLWNARVFPAAKQNESFRDWLWMYTPDRATAEQKAAFLSADRYSAAEIAVMTEQERFFGRRSQCNARG